MAKEAVDLSYKNNPENYDLDHIPGRDGIPYFGSSIAALLDWEKVVKEQAEFGNVSRLKMLYQRGVCVQGADNIQNFFLDKNRNLSAEMGYEESLNQFYRGGLLMRDFDDHKFQRRILQTAFKTPAMRTYVEMMNPLMKKHVQSWGNQEVEFFPAIKKALLEVGAKVFIGVDPDDPRLPAINKAFLDINEGLLGLLRKDIPGTKYYRGKRGEEHLKAFFSSEIPKRRESDLEDTFSLMCKEKDDDGNYYEDKDIIAHGSFLLFAAHDTTTSVLNHMMMYTSQHPEWQEKMREESLALDKEFIEYDDLDKMVAVDRVFHESLRLRPSVPLINRRTIKECEIEGVRIPADTILFLPNIAHHRDPKHWTNPEAFDPDRFSPERNEHKNHSFCYTPFGGGAHKCIGMHFAAMLSKTMMHQVVTRMEYRLPQGFVPKAEWFPLPKPKKLPVIFKSL